MQRLIDLKFQPSEVSAMITLQEGVLRSGKKKGADRNVLRGIEHTLEILNVVLKILEKPNE